jgi:hypothetical protein
MFASTLSERPIAALALQTTRQGRDWQRKDGGHARCARLAHPTGAVVADHFPFGASAAPGEVACMLGGVSPCGLSGGAPPEPVLTGPVCPCGEGCCFPRAWGSEAAPVCACTRLIEQITAIAAATQATPSLPPNIMTPMGTPRRSARSSRRAHDNLALRRKFHHLNRRVAKRTKRSGDRVPTNDGP